MARIEAGSKVVVCDAGPLIHLDELGCLDLLVDFAEVLVPTAVWAEVSLHRPAVWSSSIVRLTETKCHQILTPELNDCFRRFALHEGEQQALRIAREVHADALLTDDTAARLAGIHLGIPVHGTIGVLLRSIRRQLRSHTEVKDVLRSIPKVSTLHLKRALLDEIIREVEQSEPTE